MSDAVLYTITAQDGEVRNLCPSCAPKLAVGVGAVHHTYSGDDWYEQMIRDNDLVLADWPAHLPQAEFSEHVLKNRFPVDACWVRLPGSGTDDPEFDTGRLTWADARDGLNLRRAGIVSCWPNGWWSESPAGVRVLFDEDGDIYDKPLNPYWATIAPSVPLRGDLFLVSSESGGPDVGWSGPFNEQARLLMSSAFPNHLVCALCQILI